MNIRNMEAWLIVRLKSCAADDGMTLRDWVIAALKMAVAGKGSQAKGARPPEVADVKPAPREFGPCVTCGKPTMGWGVGKKRCTGCGRTSDEDEAPLSDEPVEGHPCPECGDETVWNKVMKRYDCECGFIGRKL